MNEQQLSELLCQSLEHEIGGVQVDQTALQCVLNAELRTEWQKYLEETGNHVRVLTETCETIGWIRTISLPDAPSFTKWELHLSQR